VEIARWVFLKSAKSFYGLQSVALLVIIYLALALSDQDDRSFEP